MDVLFFYYLILTELYDTWDDVIGVIIKLGDWIAKTTKMSVKIGHKFQAHYGWCNMFLGLFYCVTNI